FDDRAAVLALPGFALNKLGALRALPQVAVRVPLAAAFMQAWAEVSFVRAAGHGRGRFGIRQQRYQDQGEERADDHRQDKPANSAAAARAGDYSDDHCKQEPKRPDVHVLLPSYRGA